MYRHGCRHAKVHTTLPLSILQKGCLVQSLPVSIFASCSAAPLSAIFCIGRTRRHVALRCLQATIRYTENNAVQHLQSILDAMYKCVLDDDAVLQQEVCPGIGPAASNIAQT